MGIFVQDSFTGTAGTGLTAHVGEIGGWQGDPTGYPNHSTALAKLDGAGKLYASGAILTADQRNATAISTIVAPQMDFYAEMVLNIGLLDPSGGNSVIRFFEHARLGVGTGYVAGFALYFYNYKTSLDAPAYTNESASTALPAFADNSTVTVRAEYSYTEETVKYFINGTMAVSRTGFQAAGNPYRSPPTVPGLFAFDIESYNSPSGEGIQVDHLELGELVPPAAFWTDFVGNISEVA